MSITTVPLCGVCFLPGEEHEDKNHVFNVEGQLIPKKKAEPKSNKGKHRGEGPADALSPAAAVRLMDVLYRRGIIDDADIRFVILGVEDAPTPSGSQPVADG